MTSPDPLSSLLLRVRKELWRRQLGRLAGLALWVSASVLVAAGLVHVLLTPVAFPVGALLLLAGPTVAAAMALWRQWPDLQEAAITLDREGRYNEFFQSAREAKIMAPDLRPAGARLLLVRAQKIAGEVELPSALLNVAPVFSRFGYVPLALLACGLFLLQLPGATTELRPSSPGQAAGPGTPVSGELAADVGEWVSSPITPSGAPAPEPVVISPAQQPAVLSPQAPAQGPRDSPGSRIAGAMSAEDTAGDVDPEGIAAVDHPRVGDEARAMGAAAARASEGNARKSGGPMGDGEAPFRQQVEFVDLARLAAGDSPVVRGNKALETVPGIDTPAARVGAATAIAAITPASSWVGYFSHHQRRQIADYFQLIEESP